MKTWTISDLKNHAISDKIPIITDDALIYIQNHIQNHQVKSVLEIGTAYGYSAITMSSKSTHVDTFERDLKRINEAKIWIERLDANVTLYETDALTFDALDKTYDLIFIDAAKSQYENLFNKFKDLLNPGGVVICDNINFHNLTAQSVKNRRTRSLLRKLDKFRTFLNEHPAFETEFLNIGDGLSVSRRMDD